MRITPAWHSKMASLVDPVSNLGINNGSATFLVLGNTDGNNQWLVSKIRFVGLEITTTDSTEAHTSSDPLPWFVLISTPPFSSNIIFDRCYIHGQGTPNRITAAFFWNGLNMGIVDSYFDNLTYYHSMQSAVISRTSGSTFAVTAGTGNGGGNVLIPAFTGTVSGAGSGVAYVYLEMANGNALTVSRPAAISVSCSGAACLNGGAPGTSNGTCSLWNSGSRDGWPLIGCINISSGSIAGVQQADASTSEFNTEGSNFMIGGNGPGPYMVENTHIEGGGLVWHHDESGGVSRVRGDYT